MASRSMLKSSLMTYAISMGDLTEFKAVHPMFKEWLCYMWSGAFKP